MKQPFPDSGKAGFSNQDLQRLRQHSNHHLLPLHPSDVYPDISADDSRHRKSNSISSLNSIRRPTNNPDPAQYLPPRRRPTLSHDSSSKHLLALRATVQDPLLHHSHHPTPIQQKPRSNSVSINPQLSIGNPRQTLTTQKSSSSLRSRTPVSTEPTSTQSLLSSLNLSGNRSSSALGTSSYYHSHQQQQQQQQPRYPRLQQPPRSNFLPVNIQTHSYQTIGSIKNSLIESVNSFPCSLENKLFFVAKLHAEVEAELTKLDAAPGRNYNSNSENQITHVGTRQELDDPIHLIKLSDRIKALAVRQLKQDLYR